MLDEIELSSDGRYSDAYYFADGSISNWNGRKILSETPDGAIPHIFLISSLTDQDIEFRITKANIELFDDLEQSIEAEPDNLIAKSLAKRLNKMRQLIGHKYRRVFRETRKGLGQLDEFAKKGGGHVNMSVSTPLGPSSTSNPYPKRTVEEELKDKKPTHHQTAFNHNQDLLPSTIPMIQQIVQDAASTTPHFRSTEFTPEKPHKWNIDPFPMKFISPINTPEYVPNTAGAMLESDTVQATPVKVLKEEEEELILTPSHLESIAHPIRRTEETEKIGSAARDSIATAVNQTKPEQPSSFGDKAWTALKEAASGVTHLAWKSVGILGESLLGLNEVFTPTPPSRFDKENTPKNVWEQGIVPSVHEKIDDAFNTDIKDEHDRRNDGVFKQILDSVVLNPLSGLGAAGSKTAQFVNGSKEASVASAALKNSSLANKVGGLEANLATAQQTATAGRLSEATSIEIIAGQNAAQVENKTVPIVQGAFENIVTEKATLESLEKFKKAEALLKPNTGKYLSEIQARELIQQAGIKTFPKPQGIPENFKVKLTDRSAGLKYVHPEYEGTYVRVMPGKPHSPFPQQRTPYVNHRVNGKSLDKLGNIVENDSPAAHIPIDEFIYRE